MSGWLRLDADYVLDGRVRRARAGAVWPWVLAALKRAGGAASSDDLDPAFAAADLNITEDQAAQQLEGLRRVGLLVEADGAWSTPRWADHQPDPTGADRQRAWRERNKRKAQAAASAVEAIEALTQNEPLDRNGYAPLRDVTSPLVTHDGTVRDVQSPPNPPAGGAGSGSPASTQEAAPHIVLGALAARCGPLTDRQSAAVLQALTGAHRDVLRRLVELAESAEVIRSPVGWLSSVLPGVREWCAEGERSRARDEALSARHLADVAQRRSDLEAHRADPEAQERTRLMFRAALGSGK